MKKAVIYVTGSLPSLTSTFIYREIIALERLGVSVSIVSMNTPPDEEISSDIRSFITRTIYLDQIGFGTKLLGMARTLAVHPIPSLHTLKSFLRSVPRKGLRDWARLSYHFIEGAFLCAKLRGDPATHIHAHFVAGPSSIAMYLGGFSGIPFSFTMHGSLIYKDPIGLSEKLRTCKLAVSISEYHAGYVIRTYGEEYRKKIHIVRCGLLMEQFPQPQPRPAEDRPLRILAVGRLIEVKGFDYLLRACAEFKTKGGEFSCTIVGDGPQMGSLTALSEELGIANQVSFEGAKRQEELGQYFASADVFCLPCVIGSDGSMDGIPVVLMEAMAWQLPVITSRVAGIPELVDHLQTGILVEPKDFKAICAGFEYLRDERNDITKLGEAGRSKVSEEFNQAISAERLATLFFDARFATRLVEDK